MLVDDYDDKLDRVTQWKHSWALPLLLWASDGYFDAVLLSVKYTVPELYTRLPLTR